MKKDIIMMSKKELGMQGITHKAIERTIKQRNIAQILFLSLTKMVK